MKFYFIYSAGGGAGDWSGVKRVWKDYMPISLKSKILLKFGDIFLQHASGEKVIREKRWECIGNLRDWLNDNVSDDYVCSGDCKVLLDSGTAKAVNMISNRNPHASCDEVIEAFDRMFYDNGIFEKYIDVVCDSEIDKAVTIDIPNPFKIRSQNGNARLNILERESVNRIIELSARYSNIIFNGIKDKRGIEFASSVTATIINGTWSESEVNLFLSKLEYNPRANLAIGGLSSRGISATDISRCMDNLASLNLGDSHTVHFLGCGGIKKAQAIKEYGFSGNNCSVDCSTFINRSIDGNKRGTAQSGYFDYVSKKMMRISADTKERIMQLHSDYEQPLFSWHEMSNIIDMVIVHQSGMTSQETYDARAKLMIHNADVFRHIAED